MSFVETQVVAKDRTELQAVVKQAMMPPLPPMMTIDPLHCLDMCTSEIWKEAWTLHTHMPLPCCKEVNFVMAFFSHIGSVEGYTHYQYKVNLHWTTLLCVQVLHLFFLFFPVGSKSSTELRIFLYIFLLSLKLSFTFLFSSPCHACSLLII